MQIKSKLPHVGTTIFTVMSDLSNKHGAINLSQGFPNFDCPELLKERVNYYLQQGKNQYVPMPGLPLLRERIANKIAHQYQYSLNPETEITITAGATQALFTAINAYIHSGDEVILIEPAYDSYAPSVRLAGGIPIPYVLKKPDYRIEWNHLKSLVSNQTKMIIINTPHNPVGKTLKSNDMIHLQEIVKDSEIVVLSDEVYEHLIYDQQEHQSILKYPDLMAQSIAVYSFGKTFHNTGWKIGYAVGPEYLMKEFRKVHQFNVFTVNSFVQYGIADYLQDPSTYLNLPAFYQQKRDFFQSCMQGSRLEPIPCEGTYFQLFDYSAISNESDFEFAQRMTTEFGVAAIPVSVFYSDSIDEQIIRLCFAKTDETLKKAGEILQKI